ncbi:MAG: DUF2812 domain-containing protein [Lachnospiraceae bacterium]|nr:DUF2812 domain-containing protein [Lachnospiraceae bacterium]
MSESNLKREIHYFLLHEYEKEETYLREMHRNGWKLKSLTIPCFYTFEKCEPEDVVYRLDFKQVNNVAEEQEYLQLYRDYGWEYFQKMNDYLYFRKKASEDNNLEIFSDNESRVEMVERIMKKRVFPITLLLLVSTLMMLSCISHYDMWHETAFIVFFVIWLVFLIWDVYAVVKSAVGLNRLKEKYGSAERK